ncbi:MAG: hypothetical protein LC113_03070 [Acidobacteria bacterium]|nr:hypothetical protein [Acidobacteriota bacterium]
MINAIAAFFTHIPESIGLLAAGIAMAATAAGLRNLIQAGRLAKGEEQGDDAREEIKTEG